MPDNNAEAGPSNLDADVGSTPSTSHSSNDDEEPKPKPKPMSADEAKKAAEQAREASHNQAFKSINPHVGAIREESRAMQALEQAAADAAEYNGNYAVIAQPLDFLRQLDWRLEPPTREDLLHAAALCHLVYWWRGPEHRSWETLKKDAKLDSGATEALQQLTPRNKETSGASFSAEAVQASSVDALAELAPPSEAKGGGIAYEFQDRHQVHKCVKEVMDGLHPESKVVLWDGQINCAVVREPNRILVFFRGTVDPGEMKNDTRIALVPYKDSGVDEEAYGPVKVHKGFKAHFAQGGGDKKIVDCVVQQIGEMTQQQSSALYNSWAACEVVITGHSLGGATATLCAAAVNARASAYCRITLITFGSPRVGNGAFAVAIDQRNQLRHWRVQNELDICTRVPWWGVLGGTLPGAYKHTGHHIWLSNGKIRWQVDRVFKSASRPMNLLAYPFRGLLNSNKADIRVHMMRGKFSKNGYIAHIEDWEWHIEEAQTVNLSVI